MFHIYINKTNIKLYLHCSTTKLNAKIRTVFFKVIFSRNLLFSSLSLSLGSPSFPLSCFTLSLVPSLRPLFWILLLNEDKKFVKILVSFNFIKLKRSKKVNLKLSFEKNDYNYMVNGYVYEMYIPLTTLLTLLEVISNAITLWK